MKTIRIIKSISKDPAFNMAAEEYILRCMNPDFSYFILWKNSPSVIIGKQQNAVTEVDLCYTKANSIAVIRRLTGGGAVYHDEGTLNYSFIPNESIENSVDILTKPLCHACQEYGITLALSGRNDLLYEGVKISGLASGFLDDSYLVHGCALIDSDLTVLEKCLTPSKEKMSSHGTVSVRSRVSNVKEIALKRSPADGKTLSVESIMDSMTDFMLKTEDAAMYELTGDEIRSIEELAEARYRSDAWNYGYFSHYDTTKSRYVKGCGQIILSMNIISDRIMALEIQGDYFAKEPVEQLIDALEGKLLNEEALYDALAQIDVTKIIRGLNNDALIHIMLDM